MGDVAGVLEARCKHGERRIVCDRCHSAEMWGVVEVQAKQYDELAARLAAMSAQLDAAHAVNNRLIEENQWLHARLREEET